MLGEPSDQGSGLLGGQRHAGRGSSLPEAEQRRHGTDRLGVPGRDPEDRFIVAELGGMHPRHGPELRNHPAPRRVALHARLS
jgi:hypothetical protein